MSRFLLLGAGLAVLAVFLTTIAPGIFWRDSAEFVMLPFNLDIGHPAGSPAFTMLAGLLARVPVGSIAFRSNLYSALAGALALLFFVFAGRAVIRQAAPDLPPSLASALAVFAAAPLPFSTGFWYWAVTAEVYTSLLGAVALAVGLTLNATTDPRNPDRRMLLTVALLLGLACGLHMVVILYAPAFGVYLFLTRRDDFTFGRIFPFALMFAVGFSVFALLPIRSAADPPFDYGNPETWQALLAHITGRKYSELLQSFPWHRMAENLGRLAGHIRSQLSVAHGILALAGLAALLVRAPRVALLLILIAAGHLYLYIRDWSRDFGYLTIYLLAALAAAAALGVGVQAALRRQGPSIAQPMAALFSLLALGAAACQAYANFDACNRKGHDLLLLQSRALLDSLPGDAILASYEDNINYAFVYARSIERWREDVIHFHRAYLDEPGILAARHLDLDTRSLDGRPYAYQRFFADNAKRHSPFWDFGWEGPEWFHLENLEPYGRLMRIADSPVTDLAAAHRSSMDLWNKTMQPIVENPLFNQYDWTAMEVTARFWSGRAKYYFDRGDLKLARIALDRATALRPDFPSLYAQRAALCAAEGKPEGAFEELETGLALDPLEEKLWLTKGHMAIQAGDFKTASVALERTLTLNKAQPEAAYLLAHSRYREEDYPGAEKAAARGLVYARDPDRIARLYELLALSLMRQDRFGEAVDRLKKALAGRPDETRLQQLLTACEEHLKKP